MPLYQLPDMLTLGPPVQLPEQCFIKPILQNAGWNQRDSSKKKPEVPKSHTLGFFSPRATGAFDLIIHQVKTNSFSCFIHSLGLAGSLECSNNYMDLDKYRETKTAGLIRPIIWKTHTSKGLQCWDKMLEKQ